MNEEQQRRILAGDYASVGRDIKEQAKETAIKADKLAKHIYENLIPNLCIVLKGQNGKRCKWEECPEPLKFAYQMTAVSLVTFHGVSID